MSRTHTHMPAVYGPRQQFNLFNNLCDNFVQNHFNGKSMCFPSSIHRYLCKLKQTKQIKPKQQQSFINFRRTLHHLHHFQSYLRRTHHLMKSGNVKQKNVNAIGRLVTHQKKTYAKYSISNCISGHHSQRHYHRNDFRSVC